MGIDVGWDRLDTGAGAAADDADRRGRRDRHLAAEALHHAHVGSIGAGPAFLRQHQTGFVCLGCDPLEHLEVEGLGHRALKGDILLLEVRVEAHHPHADRAFAHRRILGTGHLVRRAVDIVLQDVVEEAQHVFDEHLVLVPLFPGFEVERGQAADRGPVIAKVIDPGREGNFRAEVGG